MEPTIKRREKIAVDTRAYRNRDPQRWDVIVFHPPGRPNDIWAHRIVGLPGETISFGESGLLINGLPTALPAQLRNIKHLPTAELQKELAPVPLPYLVPTNSYYALGDNPAVANDSRFWGAIPEDNIVGQIKGK